MSKRSTPPGRPGSGDDGALSAEGMTAQHTLSRREAGKAERRRQIIQAARDLIRETGNAGLSMRGLAARAGVSLATPYNLFGSKRAIVVAVLQDVREFQERFATLQIADPLERIFAALDLSIDFYVGDPDFYRTLWAAVFDISDGVRGEILNPKRNAFWQSLVDDAARAGVVTGDIDTRWLLRQMEALLRSMMYDWAVGGLAAGRLAPATRHGYALILLGAAAPEWRGPLKVRVLEAQAALG
jgi:AcrR family transcriptional regulator